MNKPLVSSITCATYDESAVQAAVERAIAEIWPGGLAHLVKPGTTVAIKVNMLMAKSPDRAVTTHPSVAKAVCNLVKECGAQAVIIDSPGGPYTPILLRNAYEKCGFAKVAEESGAILNVDTSTVKVKRETKANLNGAELLRPAIEADVLINLPKLKTHGLTTMTCAVKNLFGLVPGIQKFEYHMRSPDLNDFCSMLVGIAELAEPDLTIVDAIIGMEGEGPSSGKPYEVGAILAGRDVHAVDLVAAAMLGLKPEQVPTIVVGQAVGLCPMSLSEVDVRGQVSPKHRGASLPTASIRTHLLDQLMPRRWADRLSRQLRPKPIFMRSTCSSCGVCVRSCPPQAIELKQGELPQVELDKCIRCFCCQELCPQEAIEVGRSWLGRLLFR
ncbi:MAG: hypothetical protein FD169_1508 [Bacillota bacterium]|nr:MAG: hypothetical protein FD169_1508 [Bacillota bacterium]MBS3949473.1 DUF362 domain-containing protein [Peptococcaceae bacterium]